MADGGPWFAAVLLVIAALYAAVGRSFSGLPRELTGSGPHRQARAAGAEGRGGWRRHSSQACTTVCRAISPSFSSSAAMQKTRVPSG